MLCLLWPMLINPVCWFTLDIPIFGVAVAVALGLSEPPVSNPMLALLVILF